MKVYVVTEYKTDYDDYPIGTGTTVKSFTDKVAAQLFTYTECPVGKTRRIAEIEVDDTDSGYDSWEDYCAARWSRG